MMLSAAMPSCAGDDLGDLDVEALGLAVQVEQPEAGLVELGADRDRAGVGELGHRGAGLELRGLGDGGGAAVVAAAGRSASASAAAAAIAWSA